VRTLFVTRWFFSQDQRVFIPEHYFSTRSYAECQNVFRNYFPDSVVWNKSTIQRLVERFRETGSTGEKRRSGRPSVLSNYSLEDIRVRLLQSPRQSLRKLSQQTGMTYGSVQRATKRQNCIHTQFQDCHELKEIDKEKRMRYCRWFRQFVRNGVDILENVSFFRWGLVPFKWICKFIKFQVLEQRKTLICSMKCHYIPKKLAVGVWYLVKGL
jgi:transposase